MLDIEEPSEAERKANGLVVTSCKNLKSQACLKEQSISSKLLSSLWQRDGWGMMIMTSKKKTHGGEYVLAEMGWRLKYDRCAKPMPTGLQR